MRDHGSGRQPPRPCDDGEGRIADDVCALNPFKGVRVRANVRRSKLYTPTVERPGLAALVKAEAAAFQQSLAIDIGTHFPQRGARAGASCNQLGQIRCYDPLLHLF